MSIQNINPTIKNNVSFTPKTMGILNPPNIEVYKTSQLDEKNNNNNENKIFCQSPIKKFFAKIKENPKKVILTVGAIVLGLFLAKNKINSIQKNAKELTNNAELKTYLKEITENTKKKIKEINISFPVEKYQKYLKNPTQKEYMELTSREINLLKKLPERQKDIIQTINGTLESVRRTSGKTKQRVYIVLSEAAKGKEKELANLLEKQGKIDNTKAKQLKDLLKEVIRVEAVPVKEQSMLLGLKKPITIEVGTYNYIKTGRETIIRKAVKWIAERLL